MPPAATIADFGTGVSPILADGVVVLLHDEMKHPMIVALDANTGKVLWEKKRQSTSGFGTPAVWDTPEGKQVAAPGYARMIGYDLRSGEEKWSRRGHALLLLHDAGSLGRKAVLCRLVAGRSGRLRI